MRLLAYMAADGCCGCRWAVWQAASLLRRYKAEHAAVMDAMQRGAPVAECVRVLEAVM